MGAILLIVLGVGLRLSFLLAFPTFPFWDSLQLIHFGELIGSNGMTAPGWYWGQFNPGLPLILALLFKTDLPHVALVRVATASVTGILGLLPFLIWRDVLAFRWRLVSGALLALWPGQIFFSGVVVQDNWILPPAIALACLAVRRLRTASGRAWPVAAALLLSVCLAIRQEMLIALAPLAIVAGISTSVSRQRARDVGLFLAVLGLAILILSAQRREATRRFAITTEHGALGLFGSFMPGSGTAGWVDGRAYAAARDPLVKQGLFGSSKQLLRLTWEEANRRPGFHALRVASWLPRLALYADSDALLWSVGSPRAVPAQARARAAGFERFARPSLVAELALIQGAFAATLLVGVLRRRADILALASAVALKFAIHMLVSPLGRLVMPAIALELLAISLGLEQLEAFSRSERRWSFALAVGVAAGLFSLTPPLARLITRLDSPELVGIRSFHLDAGGGCSVRCELHDGLLTGLSPTSATVSSIMTRHSTLDCVPPVAGLGVGMMLSVDGPQAFVKADGRALQPEGSIRQTYVVSTPVLAADVRVELPANTRATVQFKTVPQTPPLDKRD